MPGGSTIAFMPKALTPSGVRILRNPGPSPSLSRLEIAQPSPVMTSSMSALYVRALAAVLVVAGLAGAGCGGSAHAPDPCASAGFSGGTTGSDGEFFAIIPRARADARVHRGRRNRPDRPGGDRCRHRRLVRRLQPVRRLGHDAGARL